MARDTKVRIPLDYYRILGLPIQATAEQLNQSHRDRILQEPRREYSDLAINARRQLIDIAYDVLGDNMRRAEYDREFLAVSKGVSDPIKGALDPDVSVPTIEIDEHLLVGALLILLELGEYELVLLLGRPYLKRDPSTLEGQQLKNQPEFPDIVLTLAVACLELGREEWQQNNYEYADESLGTGRELLLKEELFPVLRAEIQSDLYKLRPYRTLELIARPLEQKQPRRSGITLLRSMLQDRGGIDGTDDDLSGLGVDDFLRFIQQLRGYLTAFEQQEIFEAEAQRPSAVGTYLAVYALLARGFAQHQPALIRRAKQMLLRLSGRQDVHLEQAVCALLLGQTEEASHALELSQEYEPLAFIREHSQGAPDLLPGLCLYAENWLQQEVFPFFRDLDQESATLKNYFSDNAVQSYLESLPLDNERSNQQAALSAQAKPIGTSEASTLSPRKSAMTDQTLSGTPSSPYTQTNQDQSMLAGQLGSTGFAGTASITDKISKHSPAQLGSDGSRGGEPNDLTTLRDRRSRRATPKWDRVALLVLAGALCLGTFLFILSRVVSFFTGRDSEPALTSQPLDIGINEPVIEVDESGALPNASGDAASIAEATISAWLDAKRAAYAENKDTSDLEDVLTGEALRGTQGDVEASTSENWYIDYDHDDLEILSVEPENPSEAEPLNVTARVVESATVYSDGTISDRFSYTDELVTVNYDLVREGDRWLIESARVE
ncbi:DnaJ domain protein [Synechococcus sp. PCC 7335]|uniref:ARC6/PARC6 family protein n=1 Tax=Synechococcus sp. (strain ATCC 29403 / PCC 7335) TaxID=91464 RepID=UPI00017EC742|nr:ARC6/PARC6 family protein [Synechococcus sp. PCC 7335]EDX87113.1 DnaJ domain protein [Synechococcus sp. PCC 7335]